MFVQDEIEAATDPLARFVGLDAYEAAGGAVRRDLFSETGEGYLQDAALLDRMAMDRLAPIAAKVRGEGWAWVDVALRVGSVDLHRFGRAPKVERAPTRKEASERAALSRRLGELERKLEIRQDESDEAGDQIGDATEAAAEIESLELACEDLQGKLRALDEAPFTYDADIKAVSGAIVGVSRDGSVLTHRGLIRPEDKPCRGSHRNELEVGEAGEGASPPRRPVHSAALMRELTAHRTLAVRAALLERPDVALTALLHCLSQRLLLDTYLREDTPVRLTTSAPDNGLASEAASTLAEARASGVLAAARQRWGDRMPGDPDRLLGWIAGLSDIDRMELLALCTALTLNDVRAEERPGTLDPLCALLGLDMADWWEAGRVTYFERVTKEAIGQAITEAAGPEVGSRYKGVSKGELARVAERDLAGRRWLPAPLRAPNAEAGAAQD